MLSNKRLKAFCLVLLTSCTAFISHAEDGKALPLVDWGHIAERLENASQTPSALSLKQLLEQADLASHSSPLLVIGAAQSHEVDSARRFAEIFHSRFGLRLILLAVLDQRPTPAFDGVIVDSEYNVVANFSLKSIKRPNQISLLKTVQNGFKKMDEFKRPARWLTLLKESTSWQPSFEANGSTFSHLAEFRSESAHQDFMKYNASMSHLVSLFTGDAKRINWLLADIEDASMLEPQDIENASPYLYENPPRVLLVRMNEALALVHSGNMYVEIFENCARFLTQVPTGQD